MTIHTVPPRRPKPHHTELCTAGARGGDGFDPEYGQAFSLAGVVQVASCSDMQSDCTSTCGESVPTPPDAFAT